MSDENEIIPGVSCQAHAKWIDIEDYHGDRKTASSSGLKQILRSPAHYVEYLKNGIKDTPDMQLGRAIHTALLEPEEFDSRFVVYEGDRRKGEFKEFKDANKHLEILRPEDINTINGVKASIERYAEVDLKSIIGLGTKEQSIFWVDEETGVPCRIRPDCYAGTVIIDVKKTQDARPYEFVRSCRRLDYDLQAAMYTEGMRHFTGQDFEFFFLAVEDTAPYGVWLHKAPAAMLEDGHNKFRRALESLARCRSQGKWPNYERPFGELPWARPAAA